jgi:hypothetical protein
MTKVTANPMAKSMGNLHAIPKGESQADIAIQMS